MMGGYTKKEYIDLLKKYEEHVAKSVTRGEMNIAINTELYRFVSDLEKFMKKDLYGKDAEIWAKIIWNNIHASKFLLISYFCMNPNGIFRFTPSFNVDEKRSFKDFFKKIDIVNPEVMTKKEILEEIENLKPSELKLEEMEEKTIDFLNKMEDLV